MGAVDIPVLANACYTVKCDKCGKTTWKVCANQVLGQGCGQHVKSVMKDVKDEDKCVCNRSER